MLWPDIGDGAGEGDDQAGEWNEEVGWTEVDIYKANFALGHPRSEVEQFVIQADRQGDGLVDYQGRMGMYILLPVLTV